MDQFGTVIHLNEDGDAKHEAVLRNIANLIDDFGGELGIELVAHGPGIRITLADHPLAENVRSLMSRGVFVTACENTLTTKNIDRSKLIQGVETVPSGVGELVRKQQKGWAYVRP